MIKEFENEKWKTQVMEEEGRVLKGLISQLGGERALYNEQLNERVLELSLVKEELEIEKRKTQENHLEKNSLKTSLQNALHHGNEMENLLKEEKKRGQEMETSLRILKVELDNRALQIQNFLNEERKLVCEKEELEEKLGVALNHGKELESLREEAELRARKITKDFEDDVQKRETQIREMSLYYQETLKQKDGELEKLREDDEDLRKECEKLKENWRIQEENMIKEKQVYRERQRRQEEVLRKQDKYMLMTLLHGTAQRNFTLEHIALQHGNEKKQDEGKEEFLQMRKEEQYRKYCDAQLERSNYGKQWEVLTQTLTDLIHEDERNPEATKDEQKCGEAIAQDAILER
ncbi:trichohyalin-like [Macrobrachium nipponense]|uniref:trichohyalin-like n=1 Tax=Macrobrachium nipponense TaxID=159736 RepID=UPI0030C890D7